LRLAPESVCVAMLVVPPVARIASTSARALIAAVRLVQISPTVAESSLV
jgi:hypothetical protein